MSHEFRIRRTDHGDGTTVFRTQMKVYGFFWQDVGFHYIGTNSFVGPGDTLEEAEDTLKYCIRQTHKERLLKQKIHTIVKHVEV